MSDLRSGDRRPTPTFGSIVTWPFAALSLTLDLFARLVRDWQDAMTVGVETMTRGAGETLTPRPAAGVPSSPESASDGDERFTDGLGGKETAMMTDRDTRTDLSGEDILKLVRYKIVFLKRDYEVAFPEEEELVAYGTSAADWAGTKVARFLCDLNETLTKHMPREWEGKNYPPRDSNGRYSIPREDERYIKVYFEVLQRWDREDADYERRRTKAIEEIRDVLATQRGRAS